MTVALHTDRSGASRSDLIPGRAVQVKQPEPQEHLVVFTLESECYGVDIGDVWEMALVQLGV